MKHASRNRMLLITFNDDDVNSFLCTLKSLFHDRYKPSLAHITIRGPFTNKTNKTTIDKIKEFILDKPPIIISGAGMFDNSGHFIVYLKAECDLLRKLGIWSKPDYDKEFNPHITIYQGSDYEKANEIYKFLIREDLSFEILDYEVVPYTLNQNQPDIFTSNIELSNNMVFGKDVIIHAIEQLKQYICKDNYDGFAGESNLTSASSGHTKGVRN